jgi:hypothetical protein
MNSKLLAMLQIGNLNYFMRTYSTWSTLENSETQTHIKLTYFRLIIISGLDQSRTDSQTGFNWSLELKFKPMHTTICIQT